jgi:hypothetical protein
LRRGDWVVCGSAAGKTTLVRLLVGKEEPSEGRISVTPGTKIGYVPQYMETPPDLTVALRMPSRRSGEGSPRIPARPYVLFSDDNSTIGTMAQTTQIDMYDGPIVFAAGTRFSQQNERYDWAIPSKDTSIAVKDLRIQVPAGSTIRFIAGRMRNFVFAKPVRIHMGSSTFSIFGAGFSDSGPNRLAEAALSAPATIPIGGKQVVLVDTLTFDEQGRVTSGRLQTDTALTVGGKERPLPRGIQS